MTCSRIMVIRCFARVRVTRHQAGGYPGRLRFVSARGPPASGRKQQTRSRNLHRAEDSRPRFRHAAVAAANQCSVRNTSTSLAKRDRISVSDSGSSAFFFPPEPRLDWLCQTGISLASGALRIGGFDSSSVRSRQRFSESIGQLDGMRRLRRYVRPEHR
jgi:hypothetical protein